MKYDIPPEDWSSIRNRHKFRGPVTYYSGLSVSDSGYQTYIWGLPKRGRYAVFTYQSSYPMFVWWKGLWFTNTRWSGPDIPLPAAIPAAPMDLARLFSSGQPSNKMLADALKRRVLSRKLIPMAVAARIGIGT